MSTSRLGASPAPDHTQVSSQELAVMRLQAAMWKASNVMLAIRTRRELQFLTPEGIHALEEMFHLAQRTVEDCRIALLIVREEMSDTPESRGEQAAKDLLDADAQPGRARRAKR